MLYELDGYGYVWGETILAARKEFRRGAPEHNEYTKMEVQAPGVSPMRPET